MSNVSVHLKVSLVLSKFVAFSCHVETSPGNSALDWEILPDKLQPQGSSGFDVGLSLVIALVSTKLTSCLIIVSEFLFSQSSKR